MKKLLKGSLICLLALSSKMSAISLNAASEGPQEQDRLVDKITSLSTNAFVITALDCANGNGVTLTQATPHAFDQDYLALRLYLSYVENAGGDQYLPIQLHINGKHIAQDATFKAVDYLDQPMSDIELKWGGWLFLTPKFNGTLYIPKTAIDEDSISSIKIAFDGNHNAELAIMSVYQCNQVGEKLGELMPVEDPYQVSATVDAGTTVKNNMVIEEETGNAGEGAHISIKPASFSSKYLAIDLTVQGVGSDPFVVTSIKINGTTIGTDDVNQIPIVQRSSLADEYIENKWPTWFFIPGGFDGTLYIDAEKYLSGITSISSIDVLFDGAPSHAGTKLKINSIAGVESIGGGLAGETYFADEGAAINATSSSNTVGNVRAGVNLEKTTFDSGDYLAVYMDLKSGAPEGDFTYIGFAVNGTLLPELGNIPYYPEGGEASSVEHKWGNWVVAPEGTKGTFYFSASTYNLSDISKFEFVYDGGHFNEFDYSIGIAHELGGTVTKINPQAPQGDDIVNFATYLPEATYAEALFDLSAIHYDEGVVDDAAVTKDEGVLVFDSFSYITSEFGGVYLPDDYQDQLVVYVKSQGDGGAPMAVPNDYGFFEIDLGENAFDLGTGFAVNVQCFSGECYFRLLLIDENGGIWGCNYNRTFQLTQNGVALGIATLYDNFYYCEDDYGTLYVSRDNLVNVTYYNGEDVDAKSEIGKIVKVGVSMDMLYGLGRKMSLGVIANVDRDTETITRVFDFSELTDEEFTQAILLPGDEAHNNNFQFAREKEQETPYFVPEECQHEDADNDGICDKCEEVIGKTSEPVSEEPSVAPSVTPSVQPSEQPSVVPSVPGEDTSKQEGGKKKGCKGEAATSLLGLLTLAGALILRKRR